MQVCDHIAFPLNGLCLRGIDAENHSSAICRSKSAYSLVGVVSHCGSDLNQGHYLSSVRDNSQRDTWLRCDDEMIEFTQEGDVLSQEAYLLVYTS